MKTTLTILITLFCLTLWGQSPAIKTVICKETVFTPDGQISESKEVALQADSLTDMVFYRKHFYWPNHFPGLFIDKRYKNQLLEIWADTTRPKDINTNWSYTYIYDSLSRVTMYSYSSCLACGQQAFNMIIKYDNLNRPIAFSVKHSFDKLLPESEKYLFAYDNYNNIIQVKYFSAGRLDKQIDKL